MFDQLVKKLKEETVSSSILNTIATMTLPFTSQQFLEMFPLVYVKSDSNIKDKVIESIGKIGNDELDKFIISIKEGKELFFYYDLIKSHFEEKSAKLLVTILRNSYCTEEIYFRAASSSTSVIHEFLINNQILLQKHPIILDLLIDNDDVVSSDKEKLKEYVKFGIVSGTSIDNLFKDVISEKKRKNIDMESTISNLATEVKEDQVIKDEPVDEFLIDGYTSERIDEEDDSVSTIEVDEEFLKELDEERLSLFQKILNMSVSQKIERALKGTKEERSLLIRDSNKMVSKAVVNSPKLTDQEAAAIAGMRNIHRDILREMGQNKTFMKKYKIVLSLAKNPKTPQDIVIRLLPRLIDRDIKLIIKDKGLPEFLRKNALRVSKTRERR